MARRAAAMWKGTEQMDASAIWELYERGIEYKSAIGLYDTVAKNERYFAGDQWNGVKAPDLPKPVVNFLKRTCQQKIAEVKANPTKVYFSPIDFPSQAATGVSVAPAATDEDTSLLNALFEADWDRLKMDAVNLDGLQDACITGDCILYDYWDAAAPTGQEAAGMIRVETIDNVNYYPGNPNERDVQKQPNLIIARREPVANVRLEAGRFGGSAEDVMPDTETFWQSGDLSGTELAGGEKCVTLTYLTRDEESGRIFAQKCARGAVVRPLWDTRLTRYPIAMMNWETRKNCCHGRAEITGLIPVQRYINQMYAMAMLFTMQSACPKPIFNQGMVKAWSNAVGKAIAVNGDVSAAARYLTPPAISQDAYNLPERLMRTTLEMAGVSNISLGNVNPSNTSALIVAREASTVPLESVKTRFYAMLEDFARNWLDMTVACQTVPRWAALKNGAAVFDAARLKKRLWAVKVDVGAATQWSEMTMVDTLGKLFDSGALTARQYIERLPESYLPMREGLLSQLADEKQIRKGDASHGGNNGQPEPQ